MSIIYCDCECNSGSGICDRQCACEICLCYRYIAAQDGKVVFNRRRARAVLRGMATP